MSSGSLLVSLSPALSLYHHHRRRASLQLADQSFTTRFIEYLQDVGFHKEREVAFSYKQAALMKIGRDGWCAPVL